MTVTDQTRAKLPDSDRLDWDKAGGLLPAVVQDADSGRVLMLGWMNPEALEHTRNTGRVTFWSRSRQCLWVKGETSGNHLELVSLHADCDHDTLLVLAHPAGPTCHRGTTSCFDGAVEPAPALAFLLALEDTIDQRLALDSNEEGSDSYVSKLARQGNKRLAQKVGEEGVEVALAGVSGDDKELLEESADLVFHLQLLLRKRGFSLKNVVQTLQKRAKPSH